MLLELKTGLRDSDTGFLSRDCRSLNCGKFCQPSFSSSSSSLLFVLVVVLLLLLPPSCSIFSQKEASRSAVKTSIPFTSHFLLCVLKVFFFFYAFGTTVVTFLRTMSRHCFHANYRWSSCSSGKSSENTHKSKCVLPVHASDIQWFVLCMITIFIFPWTDSKCTLAPLGFPCFWSLGIFWFCFQVFSADFKNMEQKLVCKSYRCTVLGLVSSKQDGLEVNFTHSIIPRQFICVVWT